MISIHFVPRRMIPSMLIIVALTTVLGIGCNRAGSSSEDAD